MYETILYETSFSSTHFLTPTEPVHRTTIYNNHRIIENFFTLHYGLPYPTRYITITKNRFIEISVLDQNEILKFSQNSLFGEMNLGGSRSSFRDLLRFECANVGRPLRHMQIATYIHTCIGLVLSFTT